MPITKELITMSQLSKEAVMAWLQNQANAQSIGMKYAVRQRVNVSANQDKSAKNLLFNEGGKSGALGRDADGNIYYMANIRGRGKFPSFPLTASKVGVTKDGKLHVEIDYQTNSDAELSLVKAWLNKTAQPTLEPAKPRSGSSYQQRQAPTQTAVETETTETVTETPASTPTVTTGFDDSKLSLVQKAVRAKAIEIGLYPDVATANANFDQWKSTTMKELA